VAVRALIEAAGGACGCETAWCLGRTIGFQPVGESTWLCGWSVPRMPSRNLLNTALCTDAGPRRAVGGAVSHWGGEQVKNLFYGRTLGSDLLLAARDCTWVFDKLKARRHVVLEAAIGLCGNKALFTHRPSGAGWLS